MSMYQLLFTFEKKLLHVHAILKIALKNAVVIKVIINRTAPLFIFFQQPITHYILQDLVYKLNTQPQHTKII